MDYNAQIKKSLISRIKDSNDINFLKALQAIFDSSEQSLYQLNDDQEKTIEEGRAQIKNDQSSPNESVMSDARGWLENK